MEQLLLVHVCSDSVATTWPLLLQAVDEADIVALDLVSELREAWE